MPDYKEYNCPVCNRQFEDGDDIVTCPICGTPHHRECYNLTGHCVNKGLHQTDYCFLEDSKKSSQDENIVEEAKKEGLLKTLLQNDDAQSDSENDRDGAEKGSNPFSSLIMPDPSQSKYDKNNEKIDGCEIGDIAAAVTVNAERFIKVFKKQSENKRKLGWNWGAFFFGSAYMFFRKMYKQGAAFLAMMFSTLLACDALIIKYAPKYLESVKNFTEAYMQGSFKTPDEIMKASETALQASDAKTAIMITSIGYGIFFIIRLIAGLFADSFYKNTVFNMINKIGESLESGASFSQTPIFMPQQEQLTQLQMKRMYLSSKGGVSVLTPFLIFSSIYLLLTAFL